MRLIVKIQNRKALIQIRPVFWVLVLILLAGTIGAILMFWVTENGPGATPDSVVYMVASRNLLDGDGLTFGGSPMTHFPPAYPLLLAFVGFFQDGEILRAARLIGSFFFGANLVLFGLAVLISTHGSVSAVTCAMLCFLFSASVTSVHAMAWSEAPFISCYLAAIILLSFHLNQPKPQLLLATAILAGLAALTRYVGVTLILLMALALLFGDRPLRVKIQESTLVTAIACLPMLAWVIRNSLVAQTFADRSLALHPIGAHHLESFLYTAHSFAFPILPVSNWTKAIILFLAATLYLAIPAILHRKGQLGRSAISVSTTLSVLCIFFALIYGAFLAVSISFLDAATPLNVRILLPAFLTLSIAAMSWVRSLARSLENKYIWLGWVFVTLLVTSLNGILAVPQALDYHLNGKGFTSKAWQNSETIDYLATIQDSRVIYSNGPEVIEFWTGKEAILIPRQVFATKLEENEDYSDQLDQVSTECQAGRALIAYFTEGISRWYLPSIEELESTSDLPVLYRFADGVVFSN